MVTIRGRIQNLLDTTGKSRKWLAEQLGVKENYLSMILTGKREPSERITKLLEKITEKKEREPHPDPYIESVIKLMEDMDEDSRKYLQNSAEREKLFKTLARERQEKEAA